jgi:hypothetical protein
MLRVANHKGLSMELTTLRKRLPAAQRNEISEYHLPADRFTCPRREPLSQEIAGMSWGIIKNGKIAGQELTELAVSGSTTISRLFGFTLAPG